MPPLLPRCFPVRSGPCGVPSVPCLSQFDYLPDPAVILVSVEHKLGLFFGAVAPLHDYAVPEFQAARSLVVRPTHARRVQLIATISPPLPHH